MGQIPQSLLAEPQLGLSNHRVGLERPGTLGRVQEKANTTGPGDAKAPQSSSLPTHLQLEVDPQVALLTPSGAQENPSVDLQMTQETMATVTIRHTTLQSPKGPYLGDALEAKAKADQGKLEQTYAC